MKIEYKVATYVASYKGYATHGETHTEALMNWFVMFGHIIKQELKRHKKS